MCVCVRERQRENITQKTTRLTSMSAWLCINVNGKCLAQQTKHRLVSFDKWYEQICRRYWKNNYSIESQKGGRMEEEDGIRVSTEMGWRKNREDHYWNFVQKSIIICHSALTMDVLEVRTESESNLFGFRFVENRARDKSREDGNVRVQPNEAFIWLFLLFAFVS